MCKSSRPSSRPGYPCAKVVVLNPSRDKQDLSEFRIETLISLGNSCDNFESRPFDWEIHSTFSDAISRVNAVAVRGLIMFFWHTPARAILLGITLIFHDKQNSLEKCVKLFEGLKDDVWMM